MTMPLTKSLTFAWTALAASICLASLAQISLKHSANRMAQFHSLSRVLPWMALWAGLLGGATACWILALRTLDISYAYPLLSLGFVLVTALAALLLREQVSLSRWVAVGLISCGAAMIAGSI